MGMSISTVAGWGLKVSVECLAKAKEMSESELVEFIQGSEIRGFDFKVCGDWQCMEYTDVLITSWGDALSADFYPIKEWLEEHFGKSVAESIAYPGIVHGFIIN